MVHQVHLDAWHKVSLLNYIAHGEPFDTKTSGIGSFVLRVIEMEENKRLAQDGLQGMQDGAFFEEAGIGRNNEDENKWYMELVNAWETNSQSKMETAIASNLDALEREQMLGIARLMLQSLNQKKIRDLSATYLTLSFAEIASKTSLVVDSLEPTLTQMVQKGAISARINKKQGTVDFIDSEG